MRPHLVVMPPPSLDQCLRFVESRELLAGQQLVAELGVEALAIAVFPRTTRLDVKRLHADPFEPGAHALGDELGAVV